jgi:hypothetical protein
MMAKKEILTAEMRESCKDELKAMTDAAYEDGKRDASLAELARMEAARKEAFEAGALAGSERECERIQAVEAASLPGHEPLIQQLKFDGKTTGPEAAQAVLAAEKTLRDRRLANLKAEAPLPMADAIAPIIPEASEANLPLEDRAKLAWNRQPELREEFTGLGSYLAYLKAEAAGKVKILIKTRQ